MGQKVHPRSLRLGIIQGWDSTWMAKKAGDYAANVKEDHVLRTYIKKRLKNASVSRIEIDRKAQRLILRIVTGRSGVVVGRGGQGIDSLRKDLTQLSGKKDIQVDVMEVAKVDADAQLVSESICQQLEKRVAYRRTMKQAMQRAMRSGVKGIKIMISGRLGGAEIARTEWAKEGRIPLHVFRADIDYGFSEALTVFGLIGVKVWIFKGEVLPGEKAIANVKSRQSAEGSQGDDQESRRGGRGGDGGRGSRRGTGGRGPAGGRSGAVRTRRVEEGDSSSDAGTSNASSEE